MLSFLLLYKLEFGDSIFSICSVNCHTVLSLHWLPASFPFCFQCCEISPAAAKSLQLCLTLCDPRDGSSPGSPVPGILQARTLEWVAISFSDA